MEVTVKRQQSNTSSAKSHTVIQQRLGQNQFWYTTKNTKLFWYHTVMSCHSLFEVHCTTTKCYLETFLAWHVICLKIYISLCDTCKMPKKTTKQTTTKGNVMQWIEAAMSVTPSLHLKVFDWTKTTKTDEVIKIEKVYPLCRNILSMLIRKLP